HCLDHAVHVHHKTSFLVPVPGRRELERGHTPKMFPSFDVLEARKLQLAMIAIDRARILLKEATIIFRTAAKGGMAKVLYDDPS
ncbi:hypothetical protein ACJ73_09729, partial [Blastomyces percursus]